jgi:RNA-directed DNA polymerase
MLLEQLAAELGLPRSYIEAIAANASYRYREYVVKGRSGHPRVVYHPSQQLKALQRWILRRILNRLPIHEAATAYEHERGIRKNAQLHQKSRFLLRMDFKEFFPSLGTADVETTLERAKTKGVFSPKWNVDDTTLLANLVCRFNRLVIGAPTSPKLANAICYELDEHLLGIARRFGAFYSRYADDLFFSATEPHVLGQVENAVKGAVTAMKHPAHLALNLSKTRHSSMRGRRVVTGIVLTTEGQLSIGRKTKRRLRSQVFTFAKLTEPERLSLRGWLAYCRSVEPEFINALAVKFGAERIREVTGW